MSWHDLIDNKLEGLDEAPFAAIIGANPSKGARFSTVVECGLRRHWP